MFPLRWIDVLVMLSCLLPVPSLCQSDAGSRTRDHIPAGGHACGSTAYRKLSSIVLLTCSCRAEAIAKSCFFPAMGTLAVTIISGLQGGTDSTKASCHSTCDCLDCSNVASPVGTFVKVQQQKGPQDVTNFHNGVCRLY